MAVVRLDHEVRGDRDGPAADPLLRLEEALWNATHRRKGPVWVDIPLDVQAADIDPQTLEAFAPPPEPDGELDKCRQAAATTARILAEARRPVVLVGNGVRHAGAVPLFLEWAESLGIPILTTWKALDFLKDEASAVRGGGRARWDSAGCELRATEMRRTDRPWCCGLDFGQTAYNHAHFAPACEARRRRHRPERDREAADGAFRGPRRRRRRLPGGNSAKETEGMHTPGLGRVAGALRVLAGARYPILLPSYQSVPSGVHN